MKKILIATTALVATASVAAAEVTLSGSSRFGIEYTEGRTQDETQITNRFTLNVDASVETDSGAEFFSRVRIRGGNEAGEGDATGASGVSAPRVGVRAGGLTVATGNILGALESTPGLYSGAVGLTGLSWGNLPINYAGAGNFWWDSFSSAGGGVNGVEVIYSANGLGLHLSHSNVSDETSLHVSYAFGDWTAALAFADDGANNDEAVLLTVAGSLGAADVGLKIGDVDNGTTSATNVTIYGAFDVASGTTITAYYTSVDVSGMDDNYGLGFTHSLGGATLAGGIASINDSTTADLGVRFSF